MQTKTSNWLSAYDALPLRLKLPCEITRFKMNQFGGGQAAANLCFIDGLATVGSGRAEIAELGGGVHSSGFALVGHDFAVGAGEGFCSQLGALVDGRATLAVAAMTNRVNNQRLVVVAVVILTRWPTAINTSKGFGWQHAPVQNFRMDCTVSLYRAVIYFARHATRHAILPAEMNASHFNAASGTGFVFPAILFEVSHDSTLPLVGYDFPKPLGLQFAQLVNAQLRHVFTPLGDCRQGDVKNFSQSGSAPSPINCGFCFHADTLARLRLVRAKPYSSLKYSGGLIKL